jgi:chlorobactene glucosyltransferase
LFVLAVQLELIRKGLLLFENLRGEVKIGPAEAKALPSERPLISIVIPAKDEEACIRDSIKAILASDYSNFELIVVNDRSTDRTAEIVEQLAREDRRVSLVTVSEVANGWTGKTYAMFSGVQEAHGNILLFSDADTFFERTTLSRALGFFHANNLVMLGLLPGLLENGFWEKVVHPHLELGFSSFYPLNRVNDSANDAALASGSFILIRREGYEAVGTWARFRGEITEDVALSKALKAQGLKLCVVRGPDLVRTRGFGDYNAMARFWRRTFYGGLEKNPGKLVRLTMNYVGLIILTILWIGSAVSALAGVATAPIKVLLILSTVGMISMIVPYCVFVREKYKSWPLGLTAPLGIVLGGWVAFTTLLIVFSNTGIPWRGSVYK